MNSLQNMPYTVNSTLEKPFSYENYKVMMDSYPYFRFESNKADQVINASTDEQFSQFFKRMFFGLTNLATIQIPTT